MISFLYTLFYCLFSNSINEFWTPYSSNNLVSNFIPFSLLVSHSALLTSAVTIPATYITYITCTFEEVSWKKSLLWINFSLTFLQSIFVYFPWSVSQWGLSLEISLFHVLWWGIFPNQDDLIAFSQISKFLTICNLLRLI
jgi:hypothetical protein